MQVRYLFKNQESADVGLDFMHFHRMNCNVYFKKNELALYFVDSNQQIYLISGNTIF